MVGIAITLIVLSSINFFGSGPNTEGIHIAFIGGLLLGVWGILSAADGYIVASPNSFFIGLDKIIPFLGDAFYLVLTFFYTLGTIGTVARSSGQSRGV